MHKAMRSEGEMQNEKTIALIGNPNVGKSSLFNALTGMHQHTGNWPGKTIAVAKGHYDFMETRFTLIDLPGTYSLEACSEEEVISKDYILSGQADCIVVVGDATCLERNLYLLFQIMDAAAHVIFCVNLLDEAARNGISIDLSELQKQLGVPVVGTSATSGEGLSALKQAIHDEIDTPSSLTMLRSAPQTEDSYQALSTLAQDICKKVVHGARTARLPRFDRLALGPWSGKLLMLVLLMAVFWITIKGANYPSSMLQSLFAYCKVYLAAWAAPCPSWLSGILLDGIYETSAKVIAVMLPPMAIFFPLFTLLEDIGYLPRVAFMMDHAFECCGSCGKQSLTMAMGFGCNAAGVVGCRIISSTRERLIAILTNSLVPCNGRFPALIVLISIFFSQNSFVGAVLLTGFIVFSVLMTLFASSFLSKTVLKGEETHFVLEIPPYRKPKIGKILVRALIDRTLHVLGRAVLVAAPMGAIIWLLQFFKLDGIPLMTRFAELLNPVGLFFGLNGIILATFILSFPANELVLPLLVMITQGTLGAFEVENTAVASVLLANGWTWQLGLATIIFLLFHWPCSTTCLTILKETKSWKWTLLSILLPTCIGLGLCFLISRI